jgi:hypothetical protein
MINHKYIMNCMDKMFNYEGRVTKDEFRMSSYEERILNNE